MNSCPHQTTTTRLIPLESSLPDGSDARRDATTQWQTCTQCGAGFYLPDVWARAPQAHAKPQVPVVPDTVDVYC